MPKDNDDLPEEIEPNPNYSEIAVEEPEKDVFLDEYNNKAKSIEELEQDAGQKSDIKAVLNYLHPKYKCPKMNQLLQSAMVSRIFPDNLLDKNYALVLSYLEDKQDDTELDVIEVISLFQDGTSIGFEGRCRVEDLEMAGVAHEEEMKKLSKDLGLG